MHQSILNNESMHTHPSQHMNIYSMHITTCKDHRCFVVDIYLINRLTFHINVDGFLCLIAQNSLHTIFQMANTHAKCTSSDPHTCIYTKPNPNQFHQSSSSTCVHALRFCTCVHSPTSTSKNFKIYNFQIRILSRFMWKFQVHLYILGTIWVYLTLYPKLDPKTCNLITLNLQISTQNSKESKHSFDI